MENLNNNLNELLLAEGFTSIQLKRNKVGHYELDSEIDGKQFKMIIDTGASNSVIDLNSSKSAGFKIEEMDVGDTCIGLKSSKVYNLGAKPVTFQSFNVDKFNFLAMDFSHVNEAMRTKESGKIDGVIGADFLAEHSALIDYSRSILYLRALNN